MTNYPPENNTPIYNRTAPDGGLAADDEILEPYPGVHVPAWAAGTETDDSADAAESVDPAYPAGPAEPAAAVDDDSSDGKVDAAKGAAQHVAGDAKDAGQHVAGVAKEEAGRVASEATDHARQLLGQATDSLKDQAGEQQQRAAGGLKNLSAQLSDMADGSDQDGIAQKVVRDLSNRAGSLGSYLEGRDPGSLLDEVKSFAARRPGTFIAIAAGAGILAGRLTKALTTEVKHEHEREQTDETGGAAL